MTVAAASPFELRGTRVLRWSTAAALVIAGHVCAATLATIYWQPDRVPKSAAGPVVIELAPMPLSPRRDTPDVASGPLTEEAAPTLRAAKEVVQEIEPEPPRVEPSPLAPKPEVVLPTHTRVDEEKPKEQRQTEEATKQSERQAAAAPLTTASPRIDAKPAPVAAAPTRGFAAAEARAKASWEKALVSHLNRYKRYPRTARRRRIEGDVRVRFGVDRAGQISAAAVVASSGFAALDEEALAVLQRASPLPAPPAQVSGATFDLVLPLQFRIK
jgi:periplasmic protein TonB